MKIKKVLCTILGLYSEWRMSIAIKSSSSENSIALSICLILNAMGKMLRGKSFSVF